MKFIIKVSASWKWGKRRRRRKGITWAYIGVSDHFGLLRWLKLFNVEPLSFILGGSFFSFGGFWRNSRNTRIIIELRLPRVRCASGRGLFLLGPFFFTVSCSTCELVVAMVSFEPWLGLEPPLRSWSFRFYGKVMCWAWEGVWQTWHPCKLW